MSCVRNFITLLSLGCALLESGCGFHPLYNRDSNHKDGEETHPSGATQHTLAAMAIAPIKDREGQYVRNQLLDTLTPDGPPSHPMYLLTVVLDDQSREAGFRRDATARRTLMEVKATFTLQNTATKEILFRDAVKSTAAYSMGSHSDIAAYPALVAEGAARKRALDLIANSIRQSLALYFGQEKTGTSVITPQ